MKNTLKLFAILGCFALLSSCQKTYTGSGNEPGITYDADAQQFITNAGITVDEQKVALNTLVKQLKDSSLWTKFKAIYPMVGGTAATTKWNLKDPRDLDLAYRITWNGAPDFKNTGVTCLTVADWGDTHLADSVLLYDNSSMSFYSGTQNQVAGYDMGCSNNVFPYNIMAIYENFTDDIVNTWFHAFGDIQYQPTITTGLFINSSYGGHVVRYDNGKPAFRYRAPVDSYTNSAVTIGKLVDNSHLGLKECRFASLGDGLTDAEALTFYNIVKKFESSLAR